jgi:hypothetical protein
MKSYSKVYYKHPFSRLGGKREDPIDSHRLYPVLNAEQLLNIKGRMNVVHQIRTQSGAPTEHFNALYKQLIDNFAEFVQNLPSVRNHHLMRVDRQLHFSSLVLALREPYIVAGELLNRVTSHEKALWNYAAFSSILLSRLGELCTQYEVPLCDEKGNYEQHWEPLLGSMNGQGTHYKIRGIGVETSRMNKNLNAIVAHSLMPLDGFLWIASNPDVLEQWLLGLNADHDEEGRGGGLVDTLYAVTEKWLIEQQKMIDAQEQLDYEKFIEELLEELILQHSQGEVPYLQDEHIHAGEEFEKWLKDGIKSDKLSINKHDSAVLVTSQGVILLFPEIFERFRRDNARYAKMSADNIFKQYAKLGTVATGNIENFLSRFPGAEEQNIRGVLLREGAEQMLQGKTAIVKQEVIRYAIEGKVREMRGDQFVASRDAIQAELKSSDAKASDAAAAAKEDYRHGVEAKLAEQAGYPAIKYADKKPPGAAQEFLASKSMPPGPKRH